MRAHESPSVRLLTERKGSESCASVFDQVELEVRSWILKAAGDGAGKHQMLIVSHFCGNAAA